MVTRVLVLEGVEASGKTHLAEALRDRGWGVAQFGDDQPPDLVKHWLAGITEAAATAVDGRVVVDRLHFSARVYGSVLRGRSDISAFDWWVVEGWLAARGGSVYYCTSLNPLTTGDRLAERYHGFSPVTQLEDTYRVLLQHSDLTTVTPAYGSEVVWLDRLTALSPVVDDGMGTRTPRYWLVGDQHNLRRLAKGRDQYGGCFTIGCGEHLARALRVAQVSWRDLHLSNAVADDGTVRDLRSKYEALGTPRVVALGRTAAAVLTTAGVPHEVVPHPAYRQRFKRREVTEYAALIWSATQ